MIICNEVRTMKLVKKKNIENLVYYFLLYNKTTYQDFQYLNYA